MATEIKVPGIGADEVEITKILVKAGDKAKVERSLITVKDGKASIEVPSPQADIVKEIEVSVGNKIQTGVLIAISDSADGTADAAPAQVEEKKGTTPAIAPATVATKDVNVSDIDSDEVEVTEILVEIGDKAEAEQPLITVEGDKASMEVPAPFAGTVREIKVSVSDKVSTGSLIMVLKVAGGAGVAAPTVRQKMASTVTPVSTASVKEVNVPDIGSDEAEVTGVMVKVGGKVAAEQSPITVEDDKVSVGVPAPFVGVVKELKVNVGDEVETGSPVMIFEVGDVTFAAVPAKQEAAAPAPAAKAEIPAAAPAAKAEGKSEFVESGACVRTTPLIRRLACGFGVNLVKVGGIDRKGCILREGVRVHVKEAIKRVEVAPAVIGGGVPGMLPWPRMDFSKFGRIEEAELDRIQKVSGANLSHNWVMIPYVTHFDRTGITEPEALRRQQNREVAEYKLDAKITPVVFIMKTVAVALKQMPHFNSSLPEDGQRLILKEYINTGVAVDTPNGLVVPVFKDINKKGIVELSRKLATISKRARDGKLTAGEMQDDCFTISSAGDLGITHFAPTVNALEVTILGVSKSAMEPVWNGKELASCLTLPISFPFDHHMIGGADGTRFVTIINSMLSDIRRLVM